MSDFPRPGWLERPSSSEFSSTIAPTLRLLTACLTRAGSFCMLCASWLVSNIYLLVNWYKGLRDWAHARSSLDCAKVLRRAFAAFVCGPYCARSGPRALFLRFSARLPRFGAVLGSFRGHFSLDLQVDEPLRRKKADSRITAPVQRNRARTSRERPRIRSEIAAGASCETLCEKVAGKSAPEAS